MDLLELCGDLQKRRRMFVPDDRYATVVAFLDGASLATPGEPLRGFTEWLSERVFQAHSPLHWAYIVVERHIPGFAERRIGINDIPMDVQQLIVEDALNLVREYLTDNRL